MAKRWKHRLGYLIFLLLRLHGAASQTPTTEGPGSTSTGAPEGPTTALSTTTAAAPLVATEGTTLAASDTATQSSTQDFAVEEATTSGEETSDVGQGRGFRFESQRRPSANQEAGPEQETPTKKPDDTRTAWKFGRGGNNPWTSRPGAEVGFPPWTKQGAGSPPGSAPPTSKPNDQAYIVWTNGQGTQANGWPLGANALPWAPPPGAGGWAAPPEAAAPQPGGWSSGAWNGNQPQNAENPQAGWTDDQAGPQEEGGPPEGWDDGSQASGPWDSQGGNGGWVNGPPQGPPPNGQEGWQQQGNGPWAPEGEQIEDEGGADQPPPDGGWAPQPQPDDGQDGGWNDYEGWNNGAPPPANGGSWNGGVQANGGSWNGGGQANGGSWNGGGQVNGGAWKSGGQANGGAWKSGGQANGGSWNGGGQANGGSWNGGGQANGGSWNGGGQANAGWSNGAGGPGGDVAWKVYNEDTQTMDNIDGNSAWKVVDDGSPDSWKVVDENGNTEWKIENVNGEWKVYSAEELKRLNNTAAEPQKDATVNATTEAANETAANTATTAAPTGGWDDDKQGRYVVWKFSDDGKGEAKLYDGGPEPAVWTVGGNEQWWKDVSGIPPANPATQGKSGGSSWTGNNVWQSGPQQGGTGWQGNGNGAPPAPATGWKTGARPGPPSPPQNGNAKWPSGGPSPQSGGGRGQGGAKGRNRWQQKNGPGPRKNRNNGPPPPAPAAANGWNNRPAPAAAKGWNNRPAPAANGCCANGGPRKGKWSNSIGGSASGRWVPKNGGGGKQKNGQGSGRAWNGQNGWSKGPNGQRNRGWVKYSPAAAPPDGGGAPAPSKPGKRGSWSGNGGAGQAVPYIIIIKSPEAAASTSAARTWRSDAAGDAKPQSSGSGRRSGYKMNKAGSSGWQWSPESGGWQWKDGWMGSGGGFGGWAGDKGAMYSSWTPTDSESTKRSGPAKGSKKSGSKMVFVFGTKRSDADPRGQGSGKGKKNGKQVIILDYTRGGKKVPKGEADMKKDVESVIRALKVAKPAGVKRAAVSQKSSNGTTGDGRSGSSRRS